MTLSVLDVQRARDARGARVDLWASHGGRCVLRARRDDGEGVTVTHSQPDEAWRRLFAALDAQVTLPDFAGLHETVTVPAHEEE